MGNAGEHIIKPLNAKNLCDVEQLHTAVYGNVLAPGFYKKKYDTSFTAIRYVGFIAYNYQNVPVAFYGVLPCFVRFPDKILLAAQSADTMTHPVHRNKGLFVQLANLTFDLCRNSGIKFVFGFPNQNSARGLIKLGWISTETMDRFIIPINGSKFGWLVSRLPALRNALNRRRSGLLKPYLVDKNGISNSAIDDGFAGVFRDHHFLTYKTYSSASVIKIGDSLVWLKVGDNLVIGDMQIPTGDFDEIINQLKKLARQMRVGQIQFHASPGTALYKLFAGRYQPIPSFPVMFKKLTGDDLPLDKVKFTFADIDIF